MVHRLMPNSWNGKLLNFFHLSHPAEVQTLSKLNNKMLFNLHVLYNVHLRLSYLNNNCLSFQSFFFHYSKATWGVHKLHFFFCSCFDKLTRDILGYIWLMLAVSLCHLASLETFIQLLELLEESWSKMGYVRSCKKKKICYQWMFKNILSLSYIHKV